MTRRGYLFNHLMARDAALAARFVQLSEHDQPRLVSEALRFLESEKLERCFGRDMFEAFKNLPVQSRHVPQIHKLLSMKTHFFILTLAAHYLFIVEGEAAFNVVVEHLFSGTLQSGETAGSDFAPFMKTEHIRGFFQRASLASFTKLEYVGGLEQFFKTAFAEIDAAEILTEFKKMKTPSIGLVNIIYDWAREQRDTASLRLLVDDLSKGERASIRPIWFRVRSGFGFQLDSILRDIGCAGRERLYLQIVAAQRDEPHARMAVWLLREMALADEYTRDWLAANVDNTPGAIRLAMLSILGEERAPELWQRMPEWFADNCRKFESWEYLVLLELEHVNWIDHEDFLFSLIERRDSDLTGVILNCGGLYSKRKLNWDWLQSYLPWFANVVADKLEADTVYGYDTELSFCCFFHRNCDPQVRQDILRAFNDPQCPWRDALANSLLTMFKPLNLAEFTDESLSFLIDRMYRYKLPCYNEILTLIATDAFVTERLLPRLNDRSELFQTNLRMLLQELGEKHRRRYLAS